LARASSRSPHPQRSAPRLNRQQRVSWLRLIRSKKCRARHFRALVNEFGGAEAAINALPVLSRRGGRAQDVRLCAEAKAEAELEAAESLGACLVTSARDIIETLAPILGRPPAPPPVELAAADEHRMPEPLPDIRQSEREQIVSALGPSPVDIDELIRATGLATRRSISCCWSSIWPAGSSVTVSSLSRSSDRGLPCDDGSFSRDSPSGSWPLPGRHR